MIDPQTRRPSGQDWFMFAISLAFVLVGLAALPSDPHVGVVTLLIFGSCLAVAVIVIRRKWRYARLGGIPAEHVSVAGGVPIRPKRSLGIMLAVWLVVFGGGLAVLGTDPYPVFFQWIGAALVLCGAILAVMTARGRFPGGYLQFDTDAFTIADRHQAVRIPWDNIAGWTEVDYHSNPVLLVDVHDAAALTVVPASAYPKAMAAIKKSRTWMGADFAIMTSHYDFDTPLLSATLARYVNDPQARRDLIKRIGASHAE